MLLRQENLSKVAKVIMIMSWLKVANLLRNPFGDSKYFDIDLNEILDHNIWKASVSIKQMENPIFFEPNQETI